MKKIFVTGSLLGAACIAMTSCGVGWQADYPYDDVDILYGNNGIGIPVDQRPIRSATRLGQPVPVGPVSSYQPYIRTTAPSAATTPAARSGVNPTIFEPGPVQINSTMPAWKEMHEDVPSAAGRFRRR